jgi:hypothetical protein
MTPSAETYSTAQAVRDCTGIAMVALLMAVLLRPFPDTPFIDDWAYSWSVQHLLETGGFLFPEVVLNPIISQVLWGALFCLPFGFSLSALRVSTWVLGVLGLCALYLLVRESGGSRRGALVGAAVLGFYPVFFILAPTYMTDVPFIAGMLWSGFLFVRALRRRQVTLVWLAAVACAASAGTRVLAVGVAGAMLATLLFHTGRWGRRAIVLAPPALVVPFVLGLFAWTRSRVFVSADITWLQMNPNRRLENLRYAIEIMPVMLVATVLFVLVYTGIALLPLALGMIRRGIVRRATLVFVLLVAAWMAAKAAGLAATVPFSAGSVWSLGELGAASSLVPGWRPEPMHGWVVGAGVTVALASAAILIAGSRIRRLGEAEKFLAWNIAAQMLLVALLWLTYDRYALVFAPLTTALVLASRPQLRGWATVVGICAYAAVAVSGTHDHLEYTGAVWKAVGDLRAEGVAVSEIDGGYVVNGWLQYLHPEDAYRDPSGRILVPMVNDVADLPYTVADRPMPYNTIVRTYPYDGWLRPDGEILVLKR